MLRINRQTLHFDLDGVIATGTVEEVYSDEAGWNYAKCTLVEGAKEGLEKLAEEYSLILSTARHPSDLKVTIDWLEKHGLLSLFDNIMVGQKPRAYRYIDDQGIKFTDWGSLLEELGC